MNKFKLLLGLSLLLLIPGNNIGTAQSAATLRINEVESNGGTPGDWFEIINMGTTAVNLSGWKMLDNDDTHAPYVFPAGATVAPGGYLVVEEADFGFGLGAADSVRLFNANGTLFEVYSWTAHAATTYARCPNGTGSFATATSSTKGGPNDCSSPVKINEVESNLGTPGDWVELFNPAEAPADVSGFFFKDNDDTRTFRIPAGTSIPAGGYLVLEEADFGFGLGAADAARLYDASGTTLVDSYTWTAHAEITYGRCPNGTGNFTNNASATKGAPNNCGAPAVQVTINEVESNLGTPSDWVELYNAGASPANISGFLFRDNDDVRAPYVIPNGTIIPAGGYFLLEEAAFGFGLGAADSARLFDPSGVAVDSYSWTAHAETTYGRCPNGSGEFTATASPTKGTVNSCAGIVNFQTWPGDANVSTAGGANVFGSNMSGLVYEGSGSANPGVLWGVRNGPGTIFRLLFDGTIWTPDPTNGWTAGKLIYYPGGAAAGSPDSEGITLANDAIYVATERDNNNNGVSRNTILRFDPASPGTTLTATHEWNLTSDLPVTGPNLGAEAIAFIPDRLLVASGFFDESKNRVYNPADYPNHGNGLFFVGVEANGNIYAYALEHGSTPTGVASRIATISSGFPGVMDVQVDPILGDLWAVCDDTCQGRTAILRINAAGKFALVGGFERPSAMPNLNNEGYAMTPAPECVDNWRPVFWVDDSETAGHALRTGTLTCTPAVPVVDSLAPRAFAAATPGPNAAGWITGDATIAWNWTDNLAGSGLDAANCTMSSRTSGEGSLPLSATCTDLAGNTATGTLTVKVDKTDPVIRASAKKADGSPYGFGTWSNQNVTVEYACSDSGSLIATCTSDQAISAEGATSTSGAALDNAGRRSESGALMVRIDKTAPAVTITGPAANLFENTSQITIDWTASDAETGSGIATLTSTLDGVPVANGQTIDLFYRSFGSHTVAVTAVDNAGNTRAATYVFTVRATVASISASIDRMVAAGAISNVGSGAALKAKLGTAPAQINAFLVELDAQLGSTINQQAYDVLRAAALYLTLRA